MSIVEEYLLLAENARREASMQVSAAQRIELVRLAEDFEAKARELHGFGLGAAPRRFVLIASAQG